MRDGLEKRIINALYDFEGVLKEGKMKREKVYFHTLMFIIAAIIEKEKESYDCLLLDKDNDETDKLIEDIRHYTEQ